MDVLDISVERISFLRNCQVIGPSLVGRDDVVVHVRRGTSPAHCNRSIERQPKTKQAGVMVMRRGIGLEAQWRNRESEQSEIADQALPIPEWAPPSGQSNSTDEQDARYPLPNKAATPEVPADHAYQASGATLRDEEERSLKQRQSQREANPPIETKILH